MKTLSSNSNVAPLIIIAVGAMLIVGAVFFASCADPATSPSESTGVNVPEQAISFSDKIILDEIADIASEKIQSVGDINDTRLAQIIENLTPQQLDDIIALEEQTKGM